MQLPKRESPMNSTHVVTRERHAHLRWHRSANYLCAVSQPLAPLAAFEIKKAAVTLPLAFLVHDERCVPMAILGVPPATNLCVAPDGRWIGPYIPAVFRTAPFVLHKANDVWQLCVDERAARVDRGPGGELFLEANGTLTPLVRDVMNFLVRIEQGRQMSERAAAALQQHDLLVPWPVRVSTQAGEKAVGGLFCVDQAAVSQLTAGALHALMQAGALALAYAQVLSMQQFSRLGQAFADPTAQSPATGAAQAGTASMLASLTTASGDLDLEFLKKSDTLLFGKL